jgi:hypothetical protein
MAERRIRLTAAVLALLLAIPIVSVAVALYVEQGACGGSPAPARGTAQADLCDAIMASGVSRLTVFGVPTLIALVGGVATAGTARPRWLIVTVVLAVGWLVALVLLNALVPDT